jgi:hypothetical protein
MKLGYKILIAIGIGVVAYKLINYNSKEKELITKKVNSIVTDIRREDYFAIQESLEPTLAQNISIDDIKRFTKDLNLSRDSRFVLDNYEKKSNIYKIKGNIITSSKEIPFKLELKDNNKTLFILKESIGEKELKGLNRTFP